MGEEEKKPVAAAEEQKKPEEEKKPEEVVEKKTEDVEKKTGDEKKEEAAPPPPPPPQEIVLKVYMHCEGCAKKVRRCLKGFPGVEDVLTDCKTSKVVVKGEKADPLKVAERVQRKSHRQVELISPIPKPPSEEEVKKPVEEEKPKPEEKKVEPPPVITVVLKVHMHCEACAQEIKKRILKMKGVESAEPDLKNSEVTVKGVFEPLKLVEYVYKRTGKQAVIIKQDPEPKKDDAVKPANGDGNKEEAKKEGDGKKGDDKEQEDKKEGNGGGENNNNNESTEKDKIGDDVTATEETKILVELKRNEYYYHPQRYAMEMYAYPPQMFSDENPNACSIM
ncbi:hypothetical protein ACFE04_027633 [Oxalis oulophora]